jgi:hypothetical protein
MKHRQIKPGAAEMIEATMNRLKTWCDAKPGRRSEVARALVVAPSNITLWIARGGYPRLATFCELIDFLDSQVPPQNQTQ